MLQEHRLPKSVRPAEFYSAETALQEQRGEESPLGAEATGRCSLQLLGEV